MLDTERTSQNTLLKAKEIALKHGLKYVYLGNTQLQYSGNTCCPKCKTLLIERGRSQVNKNNIKATINQGETASTSIPTGFDSVEWIGTVEPSNAANDDTWIDTT